MKELCIGCFMAKDNCKAFIEKCVDGMHGEVHRYWLCPKCLVN